MRRPPRSPRSRAASAHPARSSRAALWTSLLVYLFATQAFPLVALLAASVARPGAERYPCESHFCGCASAAECWSNCCCHSLEERLAWAQENHVEPPAFVLAQLRSVPPPAPKCSLCAAHSSPHDSPAPPRGLPALAGVSPLKCRGVSQSLTLAPPPLFPALRSPLASIAITPAPFARTVSDPPPAPRALEVPTPPPRARASDVA